MKPSRIKSIFILLITMAIFLTSCQGAISESPAVSDSNNTSETSKDVSEEETIEPIEVEESVIIFVGEDYQLRPKQNGVDEDAFRFSTTNVSVVSVTDTGIMSGLSAGEAEIKIRGRKNTAIVKVTVYENIDSITFEETELTLSAGETKEIIYTKTPESSQQKIEFSSTDENVATVDENGVITAVSRGKVQIVAKAGSDVSAKLDLTVLPKVEKINIGESNSEMSVNTSAMITYTVTPEDASKNATFTSSDTSVATVDATGLISAKKVGNCVITVTIGEVSSSLNLTVKSGEIEIEKINLNKTSVELVKEDTFKIKATFTPKYPTNTTLSYSSSNKNIAKVDGNGVVTAVGAGTATITVKSANGVSATLKVTVDERDPSDTPVVVDYSFLDKTRFIVFGTCEEDAIIKATNGVDTVETKADKCCFSISLPKTSTTTEIKITATKEGKLESEPTTYIVKYKTPPSEQGMWSMLWGYNYWTFLTRHSGGDLGYKDIMRTNALSRAQINAFKTRVNQKVDALKSKKSTAELIYIIVPSPATIYDECLPDHITPTNGVRRIDQIMSALSETNAKYINVIDLFEEHKNDDLKLYWKLDTHWTDYGGYLVYNELFEMISEQFPDAAPRKFNEFTFKEDYYYGGDMAVYLKVQRDKVLEWNSLRVPNFEMHKNITNVQRYVSDKQLTYRDGIIDKRVTVETNRPNLPTVVVYRDSYSTQMFDIVADRCDASYWHAMWDYTLNLNEFQQVDADYAIVIINERNIASILN